MSSPTPSWFIRPSALTVDLPGYENWDLHPGGKRIAVTVNWVSSQVVANAPQSGVPSRYVIAQNWFTDLKRLTSRTKQ